MSKQVAAYLLKNRLDKYKTEKQKHTVLINCLDKQGFIIKDVEKPYLQKHTDVCVILRYLYIIGVSTFLCIFEKLRIIDNP